MNTQAYSIAAQETVQYLTLDSFAASLAAQQNMRLDTLVRIQNTLVTQRPLNTAACVAWARQQFEELFSNNVRQLLHNFPLDRLTSTGTPFW
jgi:ubiquitin-activating enzyme E1